MSNQAGGIVKDTVFTSMIFDVDGTLWDSTDLVAQCWNSCTRERGMELNVTGDELKPLFGKLLPDIAAALWPDLPEETRLPLLEGCCRVENDYLAEHAAPLYPELEQVLKTLSARIPLFIVSNCQAGYIEAFLKSTGLGYLFRDHLCPGDTGKAKAENIRTICERYSLTKPCYIGDTQGDYEATLAAGIPFIHAGYGFGQVPKAHLRIQKPADLLHFMP